MQTGFFASPFFREKLLVVAERCPDVPLQRPVTDFVFLDDRICDRHSQGVGHPESRDRTRAIRKRATEFVHHRRRNNRSATMEELQKVHGIDLVNRARNALAIDRLGALAHDVNINEWSYGAAARAAGAVLTAVDMIKRGHCLRVFCNVRPPGHHAGRNAHAGFCIFNNVAVGVVRAKEGGFGRIAVFDWDVHHCNGTEDIFRHDPDVLVASIHQLDHYPGTGGMSDPADSKFNFPLASGTTREEYMECFDQAAKVVRNFRPDLVFVSCGFDSHRDDPLGNFPLVAEDFGTMTRALLGICPRMISVLEGGYNPTSVADSFECHARAMMETSWNSVATSQ
jgi:acetoin utilization deacetylase AcuC-like enzyme